MRQRQGAPGASYIRRLTDEYMSPHVRSATPTPVYSLVTWNVTTCIRQCHVTNEYIFKFIGTDE
jgi:hypothetical protein